MSYELWVMSCGALLFTFTLLTFNFLTSNLHE
jgi:hypothetical protein